MELPFLPQPPPEKRVVHQAERRFSNRQIAAFTSTLFCVVVLAIVVLVVSLDGAYDEAMVCSSDLCQNGGFCRRTGEVRAGHRVRLSGPTSMRGTGVEAAFARLRADLVRCGGGSWWWWWWWWQRRFH